MPSYHSETFGDGATLAVQRDPDCWVIAVFNEATNERIHIRVFGELELELDPE